MSTAFYITAEGLVYAGIQGTVAIAEAIPLFSELLNGTSKVATFNALSQGIHIGWALQDDVANPFGDIRGSLTIVYTFDLDSDILILANATQALQLPICRFREDKPVALNEFTAFEQPSPPSLNLLTFPCLQWVPSCPSSSRQLPFLTRIFSDFGHQWRHILRRPYADSTFLKFARAVLSIATMGFTVVEIASRWLHRPSGNPYVYIHDLPSWQPCEEHFIQIGRIAVVLDQDLEHAITLVRKDTTDKNETREVAGGRVPLRNNNYNAYLLLSMRHIALCRINEEGVLLCTSPATFLNGIDAPSSAAITLLICGLLLAFPRPHTWIHDFPVELRDHILTRVSEGSIEAARLGCLLELGPPFNWMRAEDRSRKGGPIGRFQSYTHRSEMTPVESQIWFEKFSGLAYR
ncbi:uncharacterized protein BP5553_09408 [Venustampulla echinocandica]|uniref:Uncharacterized protein n=1 Tax=Venustampulla echinocandica TaxID=2656787 RepID=A0A370TCP8_9HELO|nr:uncharacterized protein BP5553_09408 [Venustampulla echinocandica]RDL32006.1 hypothetical protein BP5553_09408 [Venustampulla echinocandica]